MSGGGVAKKRSRGDVEAAAKATARGVVIKLEFKGAIMKPAGPPAPLQFVDPTPVKCRWCGSDHVRMIKSRERDAVYRCFSCVDPETNDWTVFTVGRRAPPASSASPRS